jgi:hypothetical protein
VRGIGRSHSVPCGWLGGRWWWLRRCVGAAGDSVQLLVQNSLLGRNTCGVSLQRIIELLHLLGCGSGLGARERVNLSREGVQPLGQCLTFRGGGLELGLDLLQDNKNWAFMMSRI